MARPEVKIGDYILVPAGPGGRVDRIHRVEGLSPAGFPRIVDRFEGPVVRRYTLSTQAAYDAQITGVALVGALVVMRRKTAIYQGSSTAHEHVPAIVAAVVEYLAAVGHPHVPAPGPTPHEAP